MPQIEGRRPKALQLSSADNVLTGVQSLEDLDDGNVTPAQLQTAQTAMVAKQKAERAAQIALDIARDAAAAAEWDFYNKSLRMSEIVVGKFGSDSDEAQAIGRKKKSERKKAGPRPKKTPPSG